MKPIPVILTNLSILTALFTGCSDRTPISTANPSRSVETTSVPPSGAMEEVTINDVLSILGMDVWKSPVNQPGADPVKKVSLCIKRKDAEPKIVDSMDLTRDGQLSRGTLLVYLRPDRSEGGTRYVFGISHHSENSHGGYCGAFVEDLLSNPIESLAIQTNTRANIGRPGTIVLKSSNFDDFGESAAIIDDQSQAHGYFLRNE